jgi:glutamate synthase (NADPH/NADH) small chain
MGEMTPDARVDNFKEIVDGYTAEQAVLEASRCVQCGMCHDSCPTHMHAPEYIRAIWKGNVEEAVEWMYETNPFSHVCGRVCTHRCETACSLNQTGLPEGSEPIAIRWLKRYAMDAVPHERIKEIVAKKKAKDKTGKTIAIIGAGPAGLTTAFDLVKKGHEVQVFEALPKGGGMTRYGIPYYRLPDDSLERDIDVIQSMGVKIQYNTRIGEQISMVQLQSDYDAVVLAIGLQAGRSTRIPGSEHKDARSAVELLRIIGDDLEGNNAGFDIPKTAVVIGGGNVAMDIARSLARYQKQHYGSVNVTVTAIDELAKFPADKEEIKESLEEGITIIPSRGPQEIIIENDKVTGLKTWHVDSVFDEKGRFAPQYDASDEQIFAADIVIEAIGQMAETELLGDSLTEELEWERGRIKIDSEGSTSVSWLWSAGDCVAGPDVVHAVADGHRVSQSINDYLSAG